MKRAELPCAACEDGCCPTAVFRAGRADYYCRECGRNVSMALFFLAECQMREVEA